MAAFRGFLVSLGKDAGRGDDLTGQAPIRIGQGRGAESRGAASGARFFCQSEAPRRVRTDMTDPMLSAAPASSRQPLLHAVSEETEGASRAQPTGPRGRPPSGITRVGFVDALCLAAQTPRQAIEFACHAGPLWASGRPRLAPGAESTLVHVSRGELGQEPLAAERALRSVSVWLRLVEAVADTTIYPECVYLPLSPQADRRRAREAFSCVVRFDEALAGVTFRNVDLEQQNPSADPATVRVLRRYTDDRLAQLCASRRTSERLRGLLAELDDVATASGEAMAAALGIGVRTLHRRLRAESTSYRQVVQEFRLQRCVEELNGSVASAKQIAFALGFASPSSFHRAFRRWTGQSLYEYKRRHTGALAEAERGARSSERTGVEA
jgi:AraC-like DNA-binding protein